MTTEREPLPYWNDERPLGRVYFGHNDWLVHARSHLTDEAYSRSSTSEVQLFGISPTGRRTWVQTRLYIHAPEDSLHEVPIGQAQAQYYPADELLAIWELFTEERYRPHDDPREIWQIPEVRAYWQRLDRSYDELPALLTYLPEFGFNGPGQHLMLVGEIDEVVHRPERFGYDVHVKDAEALLAAAAASAWTGRRQVSPATPHRPAAHRPVSTSCHPAVVKPMTSAPIGLS